MKEGYIVWNQTCYGDGYEFFGVYKTFNKALKEFRKIVRAEFGKCPLKYGDIIDFLIDNGHEEDSYKITYFNNKEGE